MTEEMKKRATIVGVVAAVEISMGIAEGIIMPNLFERKKGEPFFLPEKNDIMKIGGTLLVTGIISGFVSEWALNKWEVKAENRAKVITGVAIGINVLETIITYNIGKKLDKDFKITLPKLHQFAPAFAFLVFTSFVGGYASDNIIASLESPSDDQLAANNKPTPSIDVILASTTM